MLWRRERDTEVLIAGAGPVGLAAALFLKERDIDLAVVEPRWTLREMDPDFTVVLHPDNLRRLADVGVEFDFAREARRVETIAIYEGAARKTELRVSEDSGPFACAAVLPLSVLHRKLLARLEELRGEVRWHHRLARIEEQQDRALASVDVLGTVSLGYSIAHSEEIVKKTRTHHPRLVIGADGRESLVRLQLKMGWEPAAEAQIVAAFEVDTPLELGTEMRVTLGPSTQSSVWPLPEGGVRLNFAMPPHRAAFTPLLRRGELPDREDLLALVRAHAPWLGEELLGEMRWAYLEQVIPTIAQPVQREHAWLLGESAALLLPLASQTLNLGLRQAHELAVALEGAGEPSTERFQEFARARSAASEAAAHLSARYDAGKAERWLSMNYPALLPLLPAAGAQLDGMARRLGLVPLAS